MCMIGREASNKYQLFICILFYKFNVVYFIAFKTRVFFILWFWNFGEFFLFLGIFFPNLNPKIKKKSINFFFLSHGVKSCKRK
jgi:hypothetical protein